jgi:hypothetical protein
MCEPRARWMIRTAGSHRTFPGPRVVSGAGVLAVLSAGMPGCRRDGAVRRAIKKAPSEARLARRSQCIGSNVEKHYEVRRQLPISY